MARRIKNPELDPIIREVEAAVSGSMIIVDKWFDAQQEAKKDLEDALELQEEIKSRILEKRKVGWEVTKEDREDLKNVKEEINRNKQNLKRLDGRISKYYKAALKDLTTRFDAFKATPGSTRYAVEYRDAMRKLALAKKQAQFKGVDIRPKIAELRGSIAALEEALKFVRPAAAVAVEQVRAAKRRLAPERPIKISAEEQWKKHVDLWKRLKARAIKTERYKTGRDKVAYAESKGLKPTRTPDVRFYEEVIETDLLMKIVKRKKERGEDVSKNLPRLKRMINSIETVMRERPRRITPAQAISALAALRKDMLAYRAKRRRSPKELAEFADRIASIKNSLGLKETVEWTEQDRRTAIASVRQLESLLTVMTPVAGVPARARIPVRAIKKRAGNPKKKRKKKAKKKKKNPVAEVHEFTTDIGFLLAQANRPEGLPEFMATGGTRGHVRMLMREKLLKKKPDGDYEITDKGRGILFRDYPEAVRLSANPKKKKRKAKKKAKKKVAKRKVAKRKTKKKVAKTPQWQRLIRRCQKLWDHYCERPGKKRLQDVLKHLEKMKASKSKKVLDERKKCLRVAKAEAKRLKLK